METIEISKENIDAIEEYFESLVGFRYSKKELEETIGERFGRKVHFSDTTDKDDKFFDYMMTCNLIGDDDDNIDYWIDADIYYLKTRYGQMYITEVNVELY